MIQNHPKQIETILQKMFIDNSWTLCTAESCTGGALSSRLTKNSGASQYFKGGIISYSNDLKEKLLGVEKKMLTLNGAVSEATVRAMCLGALKATDSDFSIATSGVAGPTGGSEKHPVGQVWIAVASKQREPLSKLIQCHGDREAVIEQTIDAVLELLLEYAQNL